MPTENSGEIEKAESLPRDENPPPRDVSISAQVSSMFLGLLPPPDLLRAYERIVPGAAEKFVLSVVQEGEHRRREEMLDGQARRSLAKAGQIIALILTLVLIGAALTLGLTGHDTVAGIIFGTTIVAIATIFALNRKASKDDSTEE
jgi:uncharacterized membrane protein